MIESIPTVMRRAACVAVMLAAGLCCESAILAQTSGADSLPDAPSEHIRMVASAEAQQESSSQSGNSPTATTSQPASGGSQQGTAETKEEKQQRAQRELEAEEKQRMLGVVPMFNVTSNSDSAPLTTKQKFQLMFKSSTDPYIFTLTAIDGGISMAEDEYVPYGQGVEGFAKYWGAAYADTFDGNFWGNALLPSLLHEDPRYFRMGHGSFLRRAGYSALTTVWCRRDDGKWGPNYANVAGNFIAGGISNLYYPAADRGVGLTFGRGASVTYEGVVGAELAEFWPDIAKRMFRKRNQMRSDQTAIPPEGTRPAEQPAPPAAPVSSAPHP